MGWLRRLRWWLDDLRWSVAAAWYRFTGPKLAPPVFGESLGDILARVLDARPVGPATTPRVSVEATPFDFVRQQANAGALWAQQSLYRQYADSLSPQMTPDEVRAATENAQHWATMAEAQGDVIGQNLRIYLHAFRGGYFEGEREGVNALADAVALLDERADRGDDNAAVALLQVADDLPADTATEAFAIAGAMRANNGAS